MIAIWTRIEPRTVLDGIGAGETFLSNGYEFTVDTVTADGTIFAYRPSTGHDDLERSYAPRTLERLP